MYAEGQFLTELAFFIDKNITYNYLNPILITAFLKIRIVF